MFFYAFYTFINICWQKASKKSAKSAK